jgi:hypothetical protein
VRLSGAYSFESSDSDSDAPVAAKTWRQIQVAEKQRLARTMNTLSLRLLIDHDEIVEGEATVRNVVRRFNSKKKSLVIRLKPINSDTTPYCVIDYFYFYNPEHRYHCHNYHHRHNIIIILLSPSPFKANSSKDSAST